MSISMVFWGSSGTGKSIPSKTQRDTGESVRPSIGPITLLMKVYGVGCLRENLTSSSYGEGLETGQTTPRQSNRNRIFEGRMRLKVDFDKIQQKAPIV